METADFYVWTWEAAKRCLKSESQTRDIPSYKRDLKADRWDVEPVEVERSSAEDWQPEEAAVNQKKWKRIVP